MPVAPPSAYIGAKDTHIRDDFRDNLKCDASAIEVHVRNDCRDRSSQVGVVESTR